MFVCVSYRLLGVRESTKPGFWRNLVGQGERWLIIQVDITHSHTHTLSKTYTHTHTLRRTYIHTETYIHLLTHSHTHTHFCHLSYYTTLHNTTPHYITPHHTGICNPWFRRARIPREIRTYGGSYHTTNSLFRQSFKPL